MIYAYAFAVDYLCIFLLFKLSANVFIFISFYW